MYKFCSQIDELIREADKDGDGQIGMCASFDFSLGPCIASSG
jgi:hypothetical protein